jgi:hypothetical protein
MEVVGLVVLIVGGIILFSFIAAIILFQKNTELLGMLAELELRVMELESRLREADKAAEQKPVVETLIEKEPEPPPVEEEILPVEVEEVPEVVEPVEPEPVPETIEPEPAKEEVDVRVPYPYRVSEPAPEVRAVKSEYWSRIEKQFIDNWAGILGSVIMVMGAAFLSIYAALKMAPFYRFLMLTGFAAALFAIFFVLRSKSKWLKLATWLRSSGCAVFLFGCLGSGSIPGLKWIDSPVYALGLLLVGVVLNLAVGTISGHQFFASFHSVISLAALSIAPQSRLTLMIAVAISLLQVILAYRDRCEYHLLVTITAFLSYHLYWVYSLDLLSMSPLPLEFRLTGIAATAILGVATALVHYRKVYGATAFDPLPFFVHLLNWIYMGTGFYLYSTGSKWNTIVLSIVTLAAFFLSRRAKKLEIRWLFITDTLIAQGLALFAVITLQRWGLTGVPIVAVLMLEVILFLAVTMHEEEEVLKWTGAFLYHLTGLALLGVAFVIIRERPLVGLTSDAAVLAGAFVVYTAFHFFLVRKKSESFDSLRVYGIIDDSENHSIGGFIAGLLALLLFILVYDVSWSPYVVAVVVWSLLLLCRRFRLNGLKTGTYLLVGGVFLWGWYHLLHYLADKPGEALIYGLPFLAIAIIGARTSFNPESRTWRKYPWIYLFSIHLAIYSFTVLNSISPLAPGTVWLLFAPIYFETSLFLTRRYGSVLREKGETPRYLLHWGYIFIALFIIRHLAVHLQSNLLFQGIHVRLLQEVLAIAIFIYWALAKAPDSEDRYKSWKHLHPLMWELAILFAVMTVGLEVRDTWHPPAWVVGAFVLLFMGTAWKKQLSRFRFYSLLFYWAAAFHIAFISTSDQVPTHIITRQAWFIGLIALVMQLGFVALFYRLAALEEVRFTGPVSSFQGWVEKVRQRTHLWVYYPYFLAVALFLYWTFDRALLTLLWVIEVFVIFTLSIVLRENHFRVAALLGLGGCLVRLIFFDLARSDTITRALVFLGVGIIMIVMNSLYNKYRERFSNE